MRQPPDPRDIPIEEAVALAIATDLTGGSLYVLDRQDLARRAALEGFRHGIRLAAKIADEIAADQGSDLVEEVARQIRTLPKDLP